MSLLALLPTVTHMASGGLRAAYLSASTEADAGYKASNTHFPRHWLYAMLAQVIVYILFKFNDLVNSRNSRKSFLENIFLSIKVATIFP